VETCFYGKFNRTKCGISEGPDVMNVRKFKNSELIFKTKEFIMASRAVNGQVFSQYSDGESGISESPFVE
jgi:hypothetical protein